MCGEIAKPMNAPTRGKKVIDSINVKRSANGGFIVRHSFDNSMSGPSYMQDEMHTFDTMAKLVAHVETVFKGAAK